ncbi:GNAT family N-acetyltransferase [Saccharothrix algeriensis]|uniref:GNAT family N-acetyltransferase n=1 Tax=Saccharothrix algeriensis TaxID=173560 RepID=A0A8T8I2T9_9PSEU|nr:GNAT family N-acetyltransferase [Saccharothrix algeriensis]MBM7810915.1 GNAT superfamily N-acetyltransferase [Saccharothrix algeriensis]QTR04921.1 GNAT family N-acetyltransferase [Saccharothrix algeriensis]
MLADIQTSLRESIRPDAEQVGPFLVRFDGHSDNAFMNYAVPDPGAEPTAAQVADLVAAFRARSRTPRLEYLRPLPAVDAALAGAGFTVDQLLPVMAVDRADLRVPPPPAGVELVEAVSDDELAAAARVQHEAFGVAALPREAAIEQQRALVADGGLLLALVDGVPVGAGAYTGPRGGLSQVAGIAVLPGFRRRGIAGAVCGRLTRWVFDAGCAPFLETEADGKAERLYGPIGYRTIGESVSVSLR